MFKEPGDTRGILNLGTLSFTNKVTALANITVIVLCVLLIILYMATFIAGFKTR